LRLRRLVNGWSIFAHDLPAVGALLAINILHLMTMSLMLSMLLSAQGHSVPFGLTLLMVALANVSTLFQITPGGVGVYEATVAIVGSMMGLPTTDLLLAMLTWRVLDAILVLVTGLPATHALTCRGLSSQTAP
jgi:uncharacterized membrane protein YbhN (UPF0104 family)